jgi:hypothetical protein
LFPSTGWINPKDGQETRLDWKNLDEYPDDIYIRPEAILMGGVWGRVKELWGTREKPKSVRIDVFSENDEPPDPTEVNFKTTASKCVNMMGINVGGYYVLISSGSSNPATNVYYYPMTKSGEGWLDYNTRRFAEKSFVVMPKVPFRVKVITWWGMNVRQSPEVDRETEPLRKLFYGDSVWITRLFPTKDGLWGEVDGNGWMNLALSVGTRGQVWHGTSFRLGALLPIKPHHYIPGTLPGQDQNNLVGIYTKTNQQVINAFYRVADDLGFGNGWSLIVNALGIIDASDLAIPRSNRNKLYTGISIDEMSISDSIRKMLKNEI